MLIDRMTSLLKRSCEAAFAQSRRWRRASELSLGTLCSYGRRTLSLAICAVGGSVRIGVPITKSTHAVPGMPTGCSVR